MANTRVGKDTNSPPIEVLTYSWLLYWDGLENLSLEFNFVMRLGLLIMQIIILKLRMHIITIKIVHIRYHICPRCVYSQDVICRTLGIAKCECFATHLKVFLLKEPNLFLI